MADPIAWGLEYLNGKKMDDVKQTVEGLDVETPLENGLNDLKSTLETAISDMGEQVDEMQETVENAPVGAAPSPLQSISSASSEDGIDITFTPVVSNGYGNGNSLPVVTKGVMVRYSTESFPIDHNDGTHAFIDDDIVSYSDTGVRSAKQKSHKVVGLTNGQTYYFTAFPYSNYGVYNENMGTSQCTKCQFTGTKGTLTITVTQDYNYKTLGEITATLTPTAGGEAKTGNRTGAGDIVVAGLDAGEYTLSFSTHSYYTAPASKKITIIAGQPNTTSAQYKILKGLKSYTWNEISELTNAGKFEGLFSLGDTKTFQGTDGKTYTMELAATKQNYANSSGTQRNPLTLVSKYTYEETTRYNSKSSYPVPYNNSDLKTVVENIYSVFPQEIKSIIKPTFRKEVRNDTGSDSTWTVDTYEREIWVPSATEMSGVTSIVYESAAFTTERNNGHSKFPLYSASSDRIKKRMDKTSSSDDGCDYWTSTCYDNLFCVFISGESGNVNGKLIESVSCYPIFAFCV